MRHTWHVTPRRAIALSLLGALVALGCDSAPAPSAERAGAGAGGGSNGRDAGPLAGEAGGAGAGAGAGAEVGEGPTLNSILPTRAPRAGGARVRIIGAGLREPLEVLIGGQPCVTLTVESESRAICEVPAWPVAEAVDVSARWLDGGGARTLPSALTYYDEVALTALSPSEGPASGNTEVRLTGAGFEDPTDVRFGSLPALSVQVVSPTELVALTPPGPPGLADVTARNANGAATLRGAFRWRSPMGVDRVDPAWAWSEGGEEVRLYGYGLLADTAVSVGDQRVELSDALPPSRLTLTTPPTPPGWASVEVTNGNGEWRRERGLLFLDPTPGDFSVLGLVPERLPSDEGGYFMVGGNGLSAEAVVTVAGERVGCEALAPQRLRCFTPGRPVGSVAVRVRERDTPIARAADLTLTFFEPLEVYAVTPPRAAIAGGALLRVTGRGLSDQVAFVLDDTPAQVVSVESSEALWLLAPPRAPGLVDLTARVEGAREGAASVGERAYLPEAVEYFDPLSRFGGAWGEPISSSVNVTTLNIYDLSPIEGAAVEVRPFDESAAPALLSGATNANGQVTLSLEDLRGPLGVTAVKAGFEVYTLERLVSENVTLVMIPYEPPEGEGDPPPPLEPARVTGRLEGLSALPKPREPGYTLRGFIDTSHPTPEGRALLPRPAPVGVLAEDGDFDVEVTPGQMSLIATAALVEDWALTAFEAGQMSYWRMRQSSVPVAMGLVRYLSLSPGASLGGVVVRLDYPMDTTALVELVNPSLAPPDEQGAGAEAGAEAGVEAGAQAGAEADAQAGAEPPFTPGYEARAMLELGPDGYWELDVAQSGAERRFRVPHLPNMADLPSDIDLLWRGVADSSPSATSYAYRTQRDLSAPVRIGPFVGAPELTSHAPNDFVSFGSTIRWRLLPGADRPATEPPEVIQARLLQSGFPVWSFTLPSGATELTLPPIPSTSPLTGVLPGQFDLQLQAMTSYGRFDYQDHTLLDLMEPQAYTVYRVTLGFR